MSQDQIDIVRAWKDEEYRASLPTDVQEKLPPAPDNIDRLSNEELASAAGAMSTVGYAAMTALGLSMAVSGSYRGTPIRPKENPQVNQQP